MRRIRVTDGEQLVVDQDSTQGLQLTRRALQTEQHGRLPIDLSLYTEKIS